MKPFVGLRVALTTLQCDGWFPGTVTYVDHIFDGHTVKLDCQEQLVYGVLFYESPPDMIPASHWQFCEPLANKL